MIAVLANRTYRHLFLAQVVALVGTGLATVALGLLAVDIAGAKGGAVLGTAMAIKMIAYIGVAPVVGAYAARLPRRAFLVAMDLIRAGVALALPFVDQVWQVYVLIFLLQSASAGFTPTFQATIPDILPDEEDYTKALSLSRLAYDMESLTSPLLAAALLTVMNFHWLFSGTAIGFACSALLVVSVTLPRGTAPPPRRSVWANTTHGARLYLATPRLRGLLAVTLSAAAASAMVIVNTPVLVTEVLGLARSQVAITLAAFGGGSMVSALLLPRILGRLSDRTVMLVAAAVLTLSLVLLGATWLALADDYHWPIVLVGWLVLGAAYAATITPGGRLLRRSSDSDERPALFAAQFALSHVCWLVAYPLSGQIGAAAGIGFTFVALSAVSLVGLAAAIVMWPSVD
ncbi:MFS transporter [Alteraurantiacibacter buctensis]|uniref:MFS transporter n=1 Tax=Alteraurantiacibacter buctensis TaxID=1503981 RepID=A0A844YTS8_9SPHN|nr:MFS transporter [Alteraurantiacibacter buctensis]MXO70271.1 MFS transporter [Alteraurantiacibacter buctensis]